MKTDAMNRREFFIETGVVGSTITLLQGSAVASSKQQATQNDRRHVRSPRHSRQLAGPGSHDHGKKTGDAEQESIADQKTEIRLSDGSPALPEQVADAMLFLASDESMAVTGHNLVADRGATAQCPVSVPVDRSEANLKELLEAQGSGWIEDEM